LKEKETKELSFETTETIKMRLEQRGAFLRLREPESCCSGAFTLL
jgi:hypothetical protein